MLQLVGSSTVQMTAAQPACPPWCSEHLDARPLGGAQVHQAHLGAAGGLQVNVWQGETGPIRVELLDEHNGEVAQIPAAHVRELAQLLGQAAVIVSATAPARRHRAAPERPSTTNTAL